MVAGRAFYTGKLTVARAFETHPALFVLARFHLF